MTLEQLARGAYRCLESRRILGGGQTSAASGIRRLFFGMDIPCPDKQNDAANTNPSHECFKETVIKAGGSIQ